MARSKCSVNRWNVLFVVVGVVVRASPINSAQDQFGRAVDSTIRFFCTFQVQTIEWTLFATPSIREPLHPSPLSLSKSVESLMLLFIRRLSVLTPADRCAYGLEYKL